MHCSVMAAAAIIAAVLMLLLLRSCSSKWEGRGKQPTPAQMRMVRLGGDTSLFVTEGQAACLSLAACCPTLLPPLLLLQVLLCPPV